MLSQCIGPYPSIAVVGFWKSLYFWFVLQAAYDKACDKACQVNAHFCWIDCKCVTSKGHHIHISVKVKLGSGTWILICSTNVLEGHSILPRDVAQKVQECRWPIFPFSICIKHLRFCCLANGLWPLNESLVGCVAFRQCCIISNWKCSCGVVTCHPYFILCPLDKWFNPVANSWVQADTFFCHEKVCKHFEGLVKGFIQYIHASCKWTIRKVIQKGCSIWRVDSTEHQEASCMLKRLRLLAIVPVRLY